ncbi:MAG TPA: hypothetical protein DCS07_00020 [Bdellovibrionales bacterium]|nr:MAG: hypothetical protein A2Z97_00980 [Bdellovibrionales bacterium GWB1_52_6]OFZ03097.1 MAG: hypothetical protein A2X97_09675 [Bdellovibrionales bacterium GWA1_52_35]OFZ41315.1 MAG: hypothetical protein A2070_08995 [Bdellovibrionales bacterium GWC1_52_8]HAR41018.1 hypothetical protein [Bdellovibrionales bacterium]HCM40425.1 hypothetical protein [Bdellovibrionales bacterium]
MDKFVGIALALVIGTTIRHPLTYRQELLKLRVQIMKEVRAPWGCPSFTKGACDNFDPKRYH